MPAPIALKQLTFGSAVLTVGEGAQYSTIQAAVNAASTGDLVLVYPGTYAESVTINAAITVMGVVERPGCADTTSMPIISVTKGTTGAVLTVGGGAKVQNLRVLCTLTASSINVAGISCSSACSLVNVVVEMTANSPFTSVNVYGIQRASTSNVSLCDVKAVVTGTATFTNGIPLDLGNYSGTSYIAGHCEFSNASISATNIKASIWFHNASLTAYLRATCVIDSSPKIDSISLLVFEGGGFAGLAGLVAGQDQSDTSLLYSYERSKLLTSGLNDLFKLNLRNITSDPTDAAAGDVWYRSDLPSFRAKLGSSTVKLEPPILSKSITIESPTSSEDISMFFTNLAITVTEMRAVVVGTTPSVTWTVRHGTDRSGTGAEVVTGGTTTTSQTSGSDVTSFNDATIVADSFVWIETTAKTGTVGQITITIFYTED